MNAKEFLESKEYTQEDEGLGYVLKVDELVDLLNGFSVLNQPNCKLSFIECKEKWASKYGKTWADIKNDFGCLEGVSKLFSFEQVLDMVNEIYQNQ